MKTCTRLQCKLFALCQQEDNQGPPCLSALEVQVTALEHNKKICQQKTIDLLAQLGGETAYTKNK